jgi:diguanylate cyclase
LNLLQLIIENIGELVIEDKFLQGQMAVLMELFSQPLSKSSLAELGERLRDVIHKQGSLKRSLNEAQSRLREMLAYFVDRLGELAESTGNYHGKITIFAAKINSASSLQELTGLVDDIAKETQLVEQSAKRSQTELQSLRTTVDQAHKEIVRLEGELEQASAMVRHDPLTGALNRKGFDEILQREMARKVRRNSLLSVSLLDVDDFKKLNDTYGHATGDDALRHLATVIRDNLRPQDSCARYGGEEFMVLLPDTALEDAAVVMRRLQRELTKRFFMHENKKMLITFSAGVAEIRPDEEPALAIERADQAMYRAKRAGKNRVETA